MSFFMINRKSLFLKMLKKTDENLVATIFLKMLKNTGEKLIAAKFYTILKPRHGKFHSLKSFLVHLLIGIFHSMVSWLLIAQYEHWLFKSVLSFLRRRIPMSNVIFIGSLNEQYPATFTVDF